MIDGVGIDDRRERVVEVQVRLAEQRLELLGELALSGSLRPVAGVLPAALAARVKNSPMRDQSSSMPRRVVEEMASTGGFHSPST